MSSKRDTEGPNLPAKTLIKVLWLANNIEMPILTEKDIHSIKFTFIKDQTGKVYVTTQNKFFVGRGTFASVEKFQEITTASSNTLIVKRGNKRSDTGFNESNKKLLNSADVLKKLHEAGEDLPFELLIEKDYICMTYVQENNEIVVSLVGNFATARLVGGQEFSSILSEHGLNDTQQLNIVFENACNLMKTVTFMHENGFPHRDIKLENTLVYNQVQDADFSKLRLADFGDVVSIDQIYQQILDAPSDMEALKDAASGTFQLSQAKDIEKLHKLIVDIRTNRSSPDYHKKNLKDLLHQKDIYAMGMQLLLLFTQWDGEIGVDFEPQVVTLGENQITLPLGKQINDEADVQNFKIQFAEAMKDGYLKDYVNDPEAIKLIDRLSDLLLAMLNPNPEFRISKWEINQKLESLSNQFKRLSSKTG